MSDCPTPKKPSRAATVSAGAIAITMALGLPRPARASETIDGTYVFGGSKSERHRRLVAIDDAVDELFFMIRGIARSRLREGTRIPRTVTLDIDGQRIAVGYDHRSYRMTLGSPPIRVAGRDGKKMKISARLEEGALVVEFRTSEGGKLDTFRVHGDGSLAMTVNVWGKKLPRPVRYTLTYRKS